MDPEEAAKAARKREKYRERLSRALREDADPLAAYVDFVNWTLDAYKHDLAHSGLIELLDEATRHFLDDDAYKSDLRYLKLWLLYAKHVEDPIVIYAFILTKEIGKIYAQTYQDYAEALHRIGKLDEAEKVYQLGIQRRARPLDPLKRRYEEFKARTLVPRRSPHGSSRWMNAPAHTQMLRKAPLKNHPATASVPAPRSSTREFDSHPLSTRPPSTQPPITRPLHQSPIEDPYGLMLAPPPPGKRPEKLRFNLLLLFTEDGVEYSMQEARARSMGLLGKKWGPPPEAARSHVAFSDMDGGRDEEVTKTIMHNFAAGAEPTVTLATKEALADVFGMYNSPEKTMRSGTVAGSKHAPVRKIEPVAPVPLLPLLAAQSSETARASSSKTPFRPFVDEDAPKGNQLSDDPVKIEPFADPEYANKSAINLKPKLNSNSNPNPSRPALSLKDPSGAPLRPKQEEIARSLKKPVIHTDSNEPQPPPIFSLTPASATYRDRPLSRPDIATDDALKGNSEGVPRPASARPDGASSASKFMPFSDENAPKVFSRPVPKSDSASTPAPTLTPFGEKETKLIQPLASSASGRAALSERTPLRPVFAPPQADVEQEQDKPPAQAAEQEPAEQEPDTPSTESEEDPAAREQFELERQMSRDPLTSESSEDAEDYDYQQYDDDGYAHPSEEPVPIEGIEDSMFDDDHAFYDNEDDNAGGYRAPLGGRFGQFDVLTPITERTFEYTTSTRGSGTPGLTVQRDAVEAAVQLAAELQEDRSEIQAYEGAVAGTEEQTGTLSLADALGVASSFKPPNPCNPFDPPIISTLLRLIPADSAFHDLRSSESQRLESLQKFAKKKSRRASGNSASGRAMQDADTLEVRLQDRHFGVVDKLGEGGFGTVFEAIDLDLSQKRGDGGHSDDDDDEDEDDEEKNRVALKVVKPRNLWEFHVLRRIHTTLPAHLRRSIITPQALYAYQDESFLVLELCKQGTLLDIVNRAPSAGISQQGACLDELLVMFFSVELLRLVEGLHRAGFIHGDMKIDNCLVRLEDVPGPPSAWDSVYQPSGAGGWAHKGIKLIDFGRTIDTRLFPAGQQYVAEWPTDARDCFEAREGRPWTFQTDYYGLAGIVYCLLYGKYIEASSVVPVSSAPGADGRVRYKLATPFKRYWQGDLWTRLFDLLLNPTLARPDETLPLNDALAALREEMEAWLQANCNRASNTLKGLLKKVGLAVLGGKDAR
ncbi:Mad3/BUB1 homology region 1-domain-containing protein [Trametes punicea]|nr:Mad3/BUB1 homology region 1-domain-containing protein [Trametes punicea]